MIALVMSIVLIDMFSVKAGGKDLTKTSEDTSLFIVILCALAWVVFYHFSIDPS